MEKTLLNNIREECQKHIDRHNDYLFQLEENTKRKEKRLNIPQSKEILRPGYWNIHPAFNPFWVRSQKRLQTYAYTLDKKLKLLTYEPQTSIIYAIPKPSGGTRNLNIFPIPDATISRIVYKSLLNKNVNRFSSSAYAYREDRNAHDAILKISYDWQSCERVYVAEFDFSKFFDQIEHNYLWNILTTKGFLYTDMEEYVLKKFLNSRDANASSYLPHGGKERKRGIPQGTSISLFLANLACWELDTELEGVGVQFARYADDTLIWSNSYEKIVHAYDVINYCGKLMGVPINFEKSEGITLLSEKFSGAELKSKSQVKFLGYGITLKKVSISPSSVNNIKKQISFILYENLLQPLKKGIFNEERLNTLDWDYVTALAQIRRYLYGGLDDIKIRRYKTNIINNIQFRGVMSYYPLVNDDDQLKKLDGWLIHSIKQTLYLRQKMWVEEKGIKLPGPEDNWIENVANIKKWKAPFSTTIYDLRIPSFLLINQAMSIGLKKGGIERVTNPKSRYYTGRTSVKK